MASNSNRRSASSASRTKREPGTNGRSSAARQTGRSNSRRSVSSARIGAASKSSARSSSRISAGAGRNASGRTPQFVDAGKSGRSSRSARKGGVVGSQKSARIQGRSSDSGRGGARRFTQSTLFARLLAIVVALAVVAVCAFALYMSPVLPIKEVKVTGAEHISDTEVAQAAAVPEGSTMLRVDTKAIESRLEKDGWIADAKVIRTLPSTLTLKITERPIAAVVTVSSTENQQDEDWAIGADGVWICKLPDQDSDEAADIPASVYEQAESAMKITDVPYGVAPVAGSKSTDASVTNALAIISGMTTDLADSVVSISATDGKNATLMLDNGIEIAFGEAKDIRTKERVCLELMDEYPDQIAYINVRVADRPTWRSM